MPFLWLWTHLAWLRFHCVDTVGENGQCFGYYSPGGWDTGNPHRDHSFGQTAGAALTAGRGSDGDGPHELFVCCLGFIYCTLRATGVKSASTKVRSIMWSDLPGQKTWPPSSHCWRDVFFFFFKASMQSSGLHSCSTFKYFLWRINDNNSKQLSGQHEETGLTSEGFLL